MDISKDKPLTDEQKCDWIQLARTSTVGPVAFAGLMTRFNGDASAALAALPNIAKSPRLSIPDRSLVEDEFSQSRDFGAQILAACEPDYPLSLRVLSPPPPIITVYGDASILHRPCLAIVGSRNASAIGLRFARQIATELSEAGYVIISGLARGIDTSAHYGALTGGTGAVLGGGIDHIYPRENATLYDEIKNQGVIISESPIGYRAQARDFPRRNRIISGLSLGVIVIEAAERSGTLITARYAMEQGREVMAAPGSPLDPRSKGCNHLIRQGASLIENSQDIIDCINQMETPTLLSEPKDTYLAPSFDWKMANQEIEKAKLKILPLLSPTATPRDEIIRQSGISVPIANAALLELELAGQINVEADGRTSLSY